jgi:outer membrane protein OmpA-like peptidoglycan-associated protein
MKSFFLLTGFLLIALTPLLAQSPSIVFDSTLVYRQTEVYFDFGESFIRPEADSSLRQLQMDFAHRPQAEYLIQAHTDAIGSDRSNQILSAARADSVAAFLLQIGVAPTQIRLETFGEMQPQATNATEAGRQFNRRATVRVQEVRPMYILEGQVTDATSGEPVPADIVIRTREMTDSTSADDQGIFRIPVPDQTVINLESFSRGYYFHSEMLKTDSRKSIRLEVPLPKVEVGMIVALQHFYFVGNQDTLLPRSRQELHRLLRFMQINPEVRIEIAGHINLPNSPPVAIASWNFMLSVRRALRVYDYLVEQGIDAARLSYVGFGNWHMRFPMATSQQQQELNRRVEIRILGEEQVTSREDPLLSDPEFLEQRLQDWKEADLGEKGG